jgi:hypothetical protein
MNILTICMTKKRIKKLDYFKSQKYNIFNAKKYLFFWKVNFSEVVPSGTTQGRV